MCGIGSITLSKTAKLNPEALDNAVSTLLDRLDHRGGDACGLMAINAGGIIHTEKAAVIAKHFNTGRQTIPTDTRAVAVHTRMATQGHEGWMRNNHPVQAGRALVIHNGMVWDDHLTRSPGDPEVDTFALAVAASETAKRAAKETIQAHAERICLALAEEEGSAAVQIAYHGTPGLISARLSGSPLYSAEAEGVRVSASTIDAVGSTFKALGIDLPQEKYTYQVTKKNKRGKTVTNAHQGTRDATTCHAEGDVLVWHAGTHTSGHIEIPQSIRYSYATPYRGAWSGADYASIADRLLASGPPADEGSDDRTDDPATAWEADWMRCDCCDDWTHIDDTTEAYGGRICDECSDTINEAETANTNHAT